MRNLKGCCLVGQSEVFNYLKQQRLSGNDKFFSALEVQKAIPNQRSLSATYRQLNKLAHYDFLEVIMTGKVYDWRRLFRMKKEYL